MTDQDARAQIKAYAGLIDNAERHLTECSSALKSFRELNAICHKLVRKARPRHVLVAHIVPEAQLTLWNEFAQGVKRNGQEAQTLDAARLA